MKAASLQYKLEECLGEPLSAESVGLLAYGGVLRTLSGKRYFLKKGTVENPV